MTPRRKATGRNHSETSTRARKDGVKRRPGRPPVHTESWTKVTVVLFDRQVRFLDRLADDIRARHSAAVSRAQLIRALVDSVGDSQAASAGEPATRIADTADDASDVDAGDRYQAMLDRLGVVRRKG